MDQQMMPKLIPEVDQVYPAYDSDASLMTPDAKLSGNKVDHHQVESESSGGANSSDLSIKEGSESSLSLSDSDSESSNSTNAYYSLPMNTDRKGMFFQKIAQLETEEKKKAAYEELRRKVMMYEDEMKASNVRLQKSEEEVFWLKTELRKGAETFQSRLESEKRRVVELETKLAEGSWLVENQIKLARQEIEALKGDLASEIKQVTALEESNSRYRSQQNLLEARIASFEHKLAQSEAEKIEMKTSYNAQSIQFRDKIVQLKADRAEQVEGLNKRYDTLKSERDELHAKVDTMRAEIHNQEIQKKEMQERLGKLNLENGELIADRGSAQKLAEELRVRAVELETEVERQNGEILAMAEEKREAIRQLCFSLEHYRSDYRELREAIVGQKRFRVVA